MKIFNSRLGLDRLCRVGTLYRHFPTRDALVTAAHRNQTEQFAAAADRLAEMHPSLAALLEWPLLFVDYIGTKHGMNKMLNLIAGGASDLHLASTAQVKQTIAKVVHHAVAT